MKRLGGYAKMKLLLLASAVLSCAFMIATFSSQKAEAATEDFQPVYLNLNNAVKVEEKPSSVTAMPGAEAVLGCSSSSPEGCSFVNEITYQPLCTQVPGEVTVGDGDEVGEQGESVKVKKNSLIEIYKVTVPLALISGSQYVKDSRLAISREFPTFRAASDLIKDDEARKYCKPGVDCEKIDEVKDSSAEGPFGVHVRASMPQAEATGNPEQSDTAVIKKELTSACPNIQKSEPNPDKTNKYAEWIEPHFQAPGEHPTSRNNGDHQCVDASRINAEDLPKSEAFVSCVAETTPVDFIVSALIKLDQWAECTIGEDADPEKCEETELFGIEVDAIFGSQYKCSSGNCAGKYFDLMRQGSAIPGTASSLAPSDVEPEVNKPQVEPFYVTTACKVRVDKKDVYDIPCLWDMSPYKRMYEQQKASTGPNNPDFPATWEEYWQMVEYDVERRGLSCS
jgi:hypothetical protein